MACLVSHTTIDCHDAYALSEWWKGVLDYVDVEADPNLAGHEECMILSRDGSHRLLFIEVPEGKSVKNRIHLDLEPVEGSRDAELARLLEHGAVEVEDDAGGRVRFGAGGVLTLDGVAGRALHNAGPDAAVLRVVARRLRAVR